ncbi:hypothetical protein NDU88_006286 [Pleurodeles waltl]|uniref:Uncharacterized protein n=1 Tax=Pleurodeles waltl TaxID=8319 RepID=A0AAV7NRH3_PLEWA|nr:hypothetical protein NDU88_006286 [Pleurodeles waltl]
MRKKYFSGILIYLLQGPGTLLSDEEAPLQRPRCVDSAHQQLLALTLISSPRASGPFIFPAYDMCPGGQRKSPRLQGLHLDNLPGHQRSKVKPHSDNLKACTVSLKALST